MYQDTYYIDQSTNTFADNLAAFGLAYVLNGIADGRAAIRLEDRGYSFAVICEPVLQPAWVTQRSFFSGAPFLVTTKGQVRSVKGTNLSPDDLPEAGGELVVDYDTERQRRADFFTLQKALSPEDRRALAQGNRPDIPRPHRDWDIFRAVNPAAVQSYNSILAEWLRGREAFAELLECLLRMTAVTPNDIDGARQAWINVCKVKGWERPKDVTASQLLNPAQGKGTHALKTVWSEPGNLKSFWLLEFLKLTGLFQAGMTRVPRNTKDRKTYVLMPKNLEWGLHQSVMKDFRQAMTLSFSTLQMDILVSLRYTQAFLKHFEAARSEDLVAQILGLSPADLVSGMQTAYYKNLGNSAATMNIAAIGLPRWVKVDAPDKLSQLSQALDEHVNIVRSLDETRGDQFSLLHAYREFLSANTLEPFFEFTNPYSGFIISQRERGKYVRQFHVSTLEVLFMNNDESQSYSQIVQDEGFRNIAYAIRHSTVIPQMIKGRKGRPLVNIRYGLGQQLARKATYPGEFLAEIGEFMQLYNAENAQLREKGREPMRKNITTADIEALTVLVDRFGSKVVCNMLVAYGYASDRKAAEPEAPEQAELAIEEADLDEETESQDND